MMKMPDSLPLQLMLMAMQSGSWSGGSLPWSGNWPGSMPNFFPWLPKPKTPLEQSIDAMQNLWQQTSDQWQEQSEAWAKQNENWLNTLQPNPAEQGQSRQQNKSQQQNADSPFPRRGEARRGAATPSDFSESHWRSDPHPHPPPIGEGIFSEFFDPAFATTLGTEVFNQTTGFWQGMQAYLASDYVRPEKPSSFLWQRGSARLLDLAPEAIDAIAVLCIPSLINKSTILDLTPEASFVDYLTAQGLRPLILDWGSPGEDELDFATEDYINAYALDALQSLRDAHNGPIVLLGYCMGGIFTTAMAQLAPFYVDAMVLFATPWDFSAPETPRVLLDPTTRAMFRQWIGSQNPVPPLVTQTMFYLIDPWRVHGKYQNFPNLSGAEKQHFLAVEQWVNDGVPLTQRVAEECFVDWPQGNILSQHQWKIGRRWIEPTSIKTPTLAVLPKRDLIVPLGCALPLTEELPRCDIITPDCGHVSLVVGRRAKAEVWAPVVEWIRGKF